MYCELQVLDTSVAHVALFGSHVEPAGHAQIDVAPGALLSVNTIAGDVPLMGQQAPGGVSKERLFDSPVKPDASQLGALVVPLSILVRTTIVDPALKTA